MYFANAGGGSTCNKRSMYFANAGGGHTSRASRDHTESTAVARCTVPRLLVAVVAVQHGAAAVAVVDEARGRHVQGAVEVVARALAVEVTGAGGTVVALGGDLGQERE